MESFKANFIIFIFIVGVVALGYWAVMGISAENVSIIEGSGSADVGPVVTSDFEDDFVPTPDTTPETVTPTPTPTPVEEEPEPTPTGTHATLIGKLQDLIDDNILMKKGSRGTRVGTVQQFLKIYGINISADNDYGDTTVNAVKKFQTEQKLSADGQTGKGTYEKMIEWLEKN